MGHTTGIDFHIMRSLTNKTLIHSRQTRITPIFPTRFPFTQNTISILIKQSPCLTNRTIPSSRFRLYRTIRIQQTCITIQPITRQREPYQTQRTSTL